MSFECIKNNQSVETPDTNEHKLDMRSVCEGLGAADHIRTREGQSDIAAKLRENEQIVAEIKASFVESFKGLGAQHRDSIVSAFPAHWTGKEYPLYDLLRSANA